MGKGSNKNRKDNQNNVSSLRSINIDSHSLNIDSHSYSQDSTTKTISSSGDFSELSDKDFLFKDAHSKTRRIIATVVGFILSFLVMSYWPLIFPLLMDTDLPKPLRILVRITSLFGGMFGYIYLIIGNKRDRFSPNWKNYLIVPVLGTILCIYAMNRFSSRGIERMITPDGLFLNSVVCTIIYYYVKVLHTNTMAWVDDLFSNNSYINFTTRVIEKHINTDRNAKYYRFTVINSKIQKQTFEINDYMDDAEAFYNKLYPGTVIMLKIKQTIINDTEPLVKEFVKLDSFTGITDAEGLQNLETKNVEDDQEIEDDNLEKWGCTYIIAAGMAFLSAIINRIFSLHYKGFFQEEFHEWNYAYAIIGFVVAAIWLCISFIKQTAKGKPENTKVQIYRLPMDYTTACILVFSVGGVIVCLISGIVSIFD